jgi:hypothetical protein
VASATSFDPDTSIEPILKDRWKDGLQRGALLVGVATLRYQVDRGFPSEIGQGQSDTRWSAA